MRLLATADLHLGRRPRRLPADLAEQYACQQVWADIVECAIDQQVEAVLLAGDIVDEENRFFEAIGPLERGVERLREHGIQTIAVSGNHDHDVLPRLARQTGEAGLRLLGEGGRWERHVLEVDGQPRLQIVGWSFPTLHVTESPLPALADLELDKDLPSIGLLHGDLDNPTSSYGPLRLAELQQSRIGTWILGHIHKPTTADELAQRPILYPGCPQGCNPGAGGIGLHGPWLIDLSSGTPHFRQLALARLRYETLQTSLNNLTSGNDLQSHLVDTMRAILATLAAESPTLEVLCLHLVITGRTELPEKLLLEQARALQESDLTLDGIQICIHTISLQTTLPIDLDALQEEPGLLGELARLIQALDGDEADWSPATRSLVADAEQRLATVSNAPAFHDLARLTNPRAESRQRLRRQAWRLIAQLQQNGGDS